MSKKLLCISTTKLTVLCGVLLMAVFCTIAMSFRPVYDEDEKGIVMSGPRRSHWKTSTTDSCTGEVTYTYHNTRDFGKVIAHADGNGTVSVAGTNAQTASSGNGTATATVTWHCGLGQGTGGATDKTTSDQQDVGVLHTNEITFEATPNPGYRFVGWYTATNKGGDRKDDGSSTYSETFMIDGANYDATSQSAANTAAGNHLTAANAQTWDRYAYFEAIPIVAVTFLAPSTASENKGNYVFTINGASTTVTTSNVNRDVNMLVTMTANPLDAYYFEYWYTEDAEGNRTIISTSNPLTDYSFDEATEIGAQITARPTHFDVTFKAVELDANDNPIGSYMVNSTTVTTSDYVYNTGDAYRFTPTLTATSETGYLFNGWYTKEGKKKTYLSAANPYNAIIEREMDVYADFVFNNYTEDQKAQFKVGSTYYTDLNAANSAAGRNGTIVCTRDGILPPGNYTISNGVKLYIPWSSSETSQTEPAMTKYDKTANVPALSCYRKLTMVSGANIVCNGTICVGGQIAELGGGYFSGYPFGACGMLDMSQGGHIELNEGATLYAWGFIKGQDMDQGNNTLDVGTITVNSGATVYEDFSGENRGGSACSALANDGLSYKVFPFQGYAIQNIEVPVTYKYGATLTVYTALYIQGNITKSFPMIASADALFLLKDSRSVVRKWYDPTTDLACYELSGTSQLSAIKTNIYVSINSANFNLPIASNMHIILNDCNMTLSNPIQILPDAIIEIKANARANLATNLYLYDVDDWQKGVAKSYFASFKNLTNHKNRGDGSSKENLQDARLIVDGKLNVSGNIYSTTGGANIMSNGGGKITFPSTLASSSNIYQCWGAMGGTAAGAAQSFESLNGTMTYIHAVPVKFANLHNGDESYTQIKASKAFLNINGRWFNQTDGAATEKANHTYDFTYISSGAVSGSGETNTTTDAVYSWDKTGLELRQKWFNVTADGCANWWHGQGEQTTWFYNWTLNDTWHQFIPTATPDLYSGSNNTLYTKTSCTWEELGSTDVNCLYEISGVKKALVEGQFIALEANNNDPAYHEAEDPTKYYICFEGCNWHAADKYTEAEKAYIIEPDTFIWYDNAWMQVNFQEPFAYTIDETNVPVYYEYVDGEWVLAEPYVRVVDGLEDRPYWFFEDAFKFANSVLRSKPTITILRDLSTTSAAWSYTAANKEVTLDLSGKKLTLTVTGAGTSAIKMFDINASGTKFTITDSSDGAKGELRLIAAPNTAKQSKRWHGVYLTNGAALVLNAGKIYAEDNFKYTSTSDAGIVSAVSIAAGKSFTMNGGTIEAYSKYSAMGVYIAGSASANATVKIKGGTIHAETTEVTTAYGMYIAGGTTTITGGKIEARTKTTTAIGVATSADASGYYGTLKMEGGEIDALSTTTTAYGIQVGEAPIYSSGNTISDRVKSKATISSGTIRATSTTTKDASQTIGVRSFGTTDITGGTIEVNGTQSYAYGVYAVSGTTTISETPTIIARAPTYAYGACAGLAPATKTGVPYNGNLVISGGRFEVSATTSTYAYGVFVQALGRAVNYSTSSGYYPGNYVSAGSAIISGGEFDVQAHTTSAYGIYVKGAITQTGAKLDADGNLADPVTSAPPTCTVSGGKFKVSGTGTVLATNNAADAANYHINGGYYNNNGNLANYTADPKHVVTLSADDENRPDYAYKVGDAYLVTFLNKDGAGDPLQSSYQENGKAAVYEGETPTLASTTTESYIFDGWATEPNGAKVYEKDAELPNVTSAGATYYAYYETTALKYIVSLDASTNGGSCGTDKIYVEPGAAVGTLPTATRTGYTFDGWFTAASGGTKLTASTAITADATYYAQFTVKKYTLTWVLGDGAKVTTKGTAAAKNATGSPSAAVAYGTAITAPVVARTGYTFSRWEPLVASTMPAEAATYTAIWTPNTNTAYTVKHYLQNADGTYPAEPYETETFTGTTAASVTPEVKSYEGFVSPATQTKAIAADGKMVVEYQYARRHYTFILDAATNGGASDLPSIEVIHGTTIGDVPPDAQKGCNDFTGWYTKPEGGVKITSSFVIEYDMKKLYAQFSDDVRTYPIIYNAGAHGTGSISNDVKTCGENATLSSNTFTRTGYTQTGWSLTDDGAKTHDLGGSYTANAALTLYPFWTINTYTITWKDGSTTIETDEGVTYGATPTFNGAAPTKETDASYAYTFDGWDDGTNVYAADALPAVSAAVTYTAHYSTTPIVARVKVGTTTKYYTTINEAFDFVNLQTADTELKLLRDVTATASLVFTPAAAMTCTLDLNNCTLSGAINKLINVNLSESTFIITDNSEDKGGSVSTTLSTNARLYSVFLTAGTLKLQNGKIYANNPYKYSSGKSCAATGVYVTAGQTFTMDNGTVESDCQYTSYAIYMPAGTSTVTINNGLVKGNTTASTTAAGICNLGKGLTINGGRIVGHAYTTTAYGVFLNGGSATINGGTIEATNDTTSNKGTTTTYGIYVAYKSSTYKGVLTIPSTSTVNVFAKARTATAAAIAVGASSTGSTIAGGSFTAKTKTSSTAYGVYSSGNITVSGGTFNVNSYTTTAYGIYSLRGKVTVNGNPTFIVTSGTTTAYGAFAYGTIGKKGTGKYSGTIEINGGTFNVTSTAETAWGAYAGLASRDLRSCSATNDTVPGLHYMPGILVVNDGTFNVKATTTGAFGIVVAKAKSESGTVGTTARIPLGTVTGGKFKVESMGDANATAYAMNSATTAARLVVQGGNYSTKRTDASETSNIEDKYTAPTKSCNYWVLDKDDATYKYEVAEAYKVTWDATTNGGSCATAYTIVKKSAAIGTLPEASKTGSDFNGWFTAASEGTQVTAATTITAAKTYYAQFAPQAYSIAYKDQGDVTFSGVHGEGYPTTHTYGTATALVSPTKTGYTFEGWYDNADCTGTALTEIGTTAYTADFTLYAKWTIKQYKVTFDSNGGSAVSTIEQDYNSAVITPEDPTKTGYTFAGWSPEVPSVMPAEDTECVAQWTPNTNTPYVVKHYQQNIADDDYTEVTADRQNLTGTTATEVTPAVNTYTGFTAPSTQTVTILADGSRVVEYYYTRDSYTLTWNANGGELSGSYTSGSVKFGASITAPTASRANYDFDGWHDGSAIVTPATTMPAANTTYTAQWSLSAVTILWKSEDGETTLETDELVTIGATPSYGGETPTKATTEANTYTFDGWTTEANGAGTFYATDALPEVTIATTYYAHFSATANVASVTVSGATTYYTTLQEAFNYAADKATPTITILKDVTGLTTKLTYTNTLKTTVTIDLNGHIVSGKVNQLLYLTNSLGNYGTFIIKSSVSGGQIRNELSSSSARYCVYNYQGTLKLESGTIYNKNSSTGGSYAVYARRAFTMTGGKLEAEGKKNIYAVYSLSTTKISGGELVAKELDGGSGIVAGIYVYSGTTTISGNAKVTVTASTNAYGARVYGTKPAVNSAKTSVTVYNGVLNVEGGATFDITANTSGAYGVVCYAGVLAVDYETMASTAKAKAGNYASAGTANIKGGTFNIESKGATSYGIYVGAPVSINTAKDADGNATYTAATATPKANITGGKFKILGTSKKYAVNTNAANTALAVEGGWYNINTNLAKYTAPTKDCNYHVLPLDDATYKYEVAEAYTITFNNDNGDQLQSGVVKKGETPVYSGETPTKAADAQYTYTFDDWSPAITKVTAAATYTATYSSTVNNYEITWKDGDGNTLKTETVAYGTTPSYSGATPTKTEDEDYTYTFNDTWSPEIVAVTGNATYTAQFDAASKETGFYVDIVDVDNTSKTLTLNVTGWASSGWGSTGYVVNGTSYLKTAREEDRTLIIPYTGEAGESFSISVVNASGETVSKHNYIIPTEISTDANLGAQQMVYVKNNATLTVNTTTTVQNIYVAPGAKLVVNEDVTLTADTVFLRTTPWASAELENNGTLTGQLCYTRIIKDQSQYYQFGLPFSCDISTVRLSDGSIPTYNSAWLLRSYSENKRAEGGAGDNWATLVANKEGNIIIAGGVGYEMFSASKYYREYYFPVTLSESNTVSVSYTENGKAGEQHAGWNIVTSPLSSQYTVEPMPEGWVINWLQEDGTYSQEPANIIRPAIPFSYQAKATGIITFGSELSIPSLASRRRAESAEETIRIQWIHLDVQDADNVGDETSIYSHPTRYEETYKTGIDVAKQSFEATRALLYSSHAYGEMAFAGVADSLLEKGVALTIYSPSAQSLTISMRENNWLNRMEYVWLIDKETGIRTDLLTDEYSFYATEGTTAGRFFIEGVFVPKVATDLQNDGMMNDEMMKARKLLIDDKIYIDVNGRRYDATGKLVNGK